MIVRPERVAIGGRHDAARDGDFCGGQHAVGDRFAVAEALVFGDRLERVAGRVAEIQHAPWARLALVESDDGRP